MGCIRPATPGFLVTLVAAVLLAVVSFCVPYFKSVYFLKASIDLPGNLTGSITFGTLGYCLDLPTNGTTCSKPSIGYQLDINGLVGNKLPIDIPEVAVKWITYALFLHVVALILATGSAAFGLLAHIREMSMTCCSTCVSGIAAAVALLAFIFDLVLFFVAKSRINAVGTASIGNAIWLTLAAWVLLFFSGCFYTLGRCCVSRRPRGGDAKWGGRNKDPRYDTPAKNESGNTGYAEQMRLDAVKAEVDRKARQKRGEGGLPAFSETQPLTARIEGDHVYLEDDASAGSLTSAAGKKPSQNTLNSLGSGPQYAAGGYVQGATGNRAVDEYYNPTAPAANTYPPQPQRQGSAHSYGHTGYSGASPYAAPTRQPSGYQASAAPPVGGYYQSTSPPPTSPSQLLGVPGGYNDPYSPQTYGHTQGGSSYHTASAHSQQPSAVGYSQYDYDQPRQAYSPPPQQQQYFSPQPNTQYTSEQPAFLAPGMMTSASPPPAQGYAPTAMATGYSPAQSPPQAYSNYGGQQYPERQYTLGGDGYGASSVPPLQDGAGGYDPYSTYASNPPGLDTSGGAAYGGGGGVAMVGGGGNTSPVKGPRAQPVPGSYGEPEESPPGYDQGDSAVVGRWGKQ